MPAITQVFQCIVYQVRGCGGKNRRSGLELDALEILDDMAVYGLDDIENLVSRIEILGKDRPTKGRSLVRNEIALYIASGDCGDNNPAFFHDKGGVREPVFGVVV